MDDVAIIAVLRDAAESLTRATVHAPTVSEVFGLGDVARNCLDAADALAARQPVAARGGGTDG